MNKLTFVILMLLSSLGGMQAHAQDVVTLSVKSMPMNEFISMIQTKTDYTFFYSGHLFEGQSDVTLEVEDMEITDVLDVVLKDTGITYEVVGMQIALKQVAREANPVTETAISKPTERVLSGKVSDEHNEPLIGAGIIADVSGKGVVTDVDGTYSISLAPEDKMITVSYIGYASQKVAIDGRNVVDVLLVPDIATKLDEVVVIGYGTAPKSDLTGSVASVKIQDIADVPVMSVDHALQGRIAGVDIMSTSGDPGASTSIRVRGSRSITASNEPLIVLDGVADAVSDLNEINSDDIESISVLKDASSTAIYGSRGANGVIMVTTKKGTTKKPSFTAKASYGVSWLARKLDIMNAEEFLRYRNDYSRFNTGSIYPKFDPADYDRDTDWQKEITRPARYQNYALSLSGKAKAIRYFVSLGYTDNEGIILGSGIERLTGRMNFDINVAKWISLGFKLSGSYMDRDVNKATISGTGYANGVVYMAPTIGPYDNQNPLVETSSLINTPVVEATMQEYNRKYYNTSDTFLLTLKPIKGLTVVSQNSVYVSQRHDFRYWPADMPKKAEGEGADAYRYESTATTLSTDNTATYTNRFGRFSMEVMAGYSASRINTNSMSVKAMGLVADGLKWNNLNGIGSKENYTVTSGNVQILRQSVFGRLNVDYHKKYFLTATMRGDGSSNFAANRKWGMFPSAALRWNVRKEPFMRSVRWVEDLSLRASFGRTGNDAVAAYNSLQAYTSSTSGYIFDGVQGVTYYPGRIENKDLTWETTDQYNVALETSLFDGRLNLVVDGYMSKTKDLLLEVAVPTVTGYSKRFQNLGRTSNKGFEVTIETRNIERKKFGWTSALTLSHNTQMVDDIGSENYVATIMSPGTNSYMMYGYKAGHPLNALWGFEYAGVCHSEEEYYENIETRQYAYRGTVKYAANALGMARYVDQNNDGVLDQKDLVYLGNADPYIYGGFQNNFHIGAFKLGVYLTYSLGGSIYNYSELYMAGSYSTNQYRYMLDAWHPVRNPQSDIPRAGVSKEMLPCSFMVHDASYLRLKTLSLQYTFDFRKHIKSLTLGLSGDNLWLFTKYNGYDPDVSTESETSSMRRVDLNSYPNSRKVMLNLQVRF